MAIDDPNSSSKRGRGSLRRRASMRELMGFAAGLLAFIGIGRLFKKHPGTNDMNDKAKVYETGHEPAQLDHIENPEIKHESSDVRIRPILLAAAALVVVAVVGHLALWGFFVFLQGQRAEAQPEIPAVVDTEQVPPEPRLQAAPAAEWQGTLVSETELLSSYEWVDRDAGIVRIPIERAMLLLAQRDLPVREGGELPESDRIPGLERGYELDSEGGQELDVFTGEELEDQPELP